MRIILAHKFINLVGGAEVFFRETGRILSKHGHTVHYLTTGDEGAVEWGDGLERDQVTFIKAPNYASGSTIRKLAEVPKAIWSEQAQFAATQLIEAFKPDVLHGFAVHVHLSPSIFKAAKQANVATVMTCNDYKHICPNYKLFHHGRICTDCKGGRFYSALRNRCAKDSFSHSAASALEAYSHSRRKIYKNLIDQYTFSSDFMAEQTTEFWPELPVSWSKLRNPFNSRAYKRSLGDDGYALYFGRLVEEKGVSLLLEAAKLCPDLPIKIVGEGQDFDRLNSIKQKAGLEHVEFLGPKWGEDLNPILSRARCVVVPSLWHENFPYVINQAFAFGRPVIGSNRGGIPELIAHGERGLVFDVENVNSLATALRTLCSDVEYSEKLGQQAKEWSDNEFTEQNFFDGLMGVYGEAKRANSRHRR